MFMGKENVETDEKYEILKIQEKVEEKIIWVVFKCKFLISHFSNDDGWISFFKKFSHRSLAFENANKKVQINSSSI